MIDMTILASKPHILDLADNDDGHVTAIVQCVFGRGTHYVTLPKNIWDAWSETHRDHSKPIVRLFEYIGAQKSELLISGVCPDCWEDMMEDFDE